jgi:hypothetical protein
MTSPSSASRATILEYLVLQGVKIIMALVLSFSHGISGPEYHCLKRGVVY